jgi:hypothetical protein
MVFPVVLSESVGLAAVELVLALTGSLLLTGTSHGGAYVVVALAFVFINWFLVFPFLLRYSAL